MSMDKKSLQCAEKLEFESHDNQAAPSAEQDCVSRSSADGKWTMWVTLFCQFPDLDQKDLMNKQA